MPTTKDDRRTADELAARVAESLRKNGVTLEALRLARELRDVLRAALGRE